MVNDEVIMRKMFTFHYRNPPLNITELLTLHYKNSAPNLMQIISTISPAQFPSDSDMTRTTTVVPLRVLHQSTRKAVAEKKDSLIRNMDSIRVIHSLPTAHTERSIILQPSSPYSSQTTSRQQILHSPSTDSATVYQTFQNSQHNGHWPTVFADVPNQFSYPRLTSTWNIISDNRKNIDLLSRYQGARTLEFPTTKPLMDHQLEPWMLSPIRPGPIIPHNYIPNFTSKHPLHEESSHQHEVQVQITYLTSTTTPFLNIAEPDPVEQKNIHEFSHSSAVDGGNTAEIGCSELFVSDYYENMCNPGEKEENGEETTMLPAASVLLKQCFEPKLNNILLSLEGTIIKDATTMVKDIQLIVEKCVKECALSLTRRHRACGAVNWIPQANGSKDISITINVRVGKYIIGMHAFKFCNNSFGSRTKRQMISMLDASSNHDSIFIPAMSQIPSMSNSVYDFLTQIDRHENGLPEHQREAFNIYMALELDTAFDEFDRVFKESEETAKINSNS
uniref:RING-type domain-containing protein n=1 Tax=Heterorhabditis bacteriophora TaxID=37862 RepID=A0A1I7XQR2_HETBA